MEHGAARGLARRRAGALPVVSIAYLIAHKLHASTDHTDPERANDRYRDLIDLILVNRFVDDEDRAGVRTSLKFCTCHNRS